ncbi:uncharacterized protein LOC129599949 [Paramacrobiotus metropolitanus]|uniref:uncharacterized protein LOC129599949 n=1 Tax=Paramacrobiotus metropolitanus TaxID=2943436 RepID=UPI00244647B1|nr:uncharacterized protein LOC129599949 [Paramacrobiotus metropolitanus]
MKWLSVILLVVCTVQCAPSGQENSSRDVDCAALEESCTEYWNYWLIGDDFIQNLPWPLTAQDISRYTPLTQEYCRNAKGAGSCVRDMISNCQHISTATTFRDKSAQGESYTALGNLCESVDALQFFAVQECVRRKSMADVIEFEPQGTENQSRDAFYSQLCTNMKNIADKLKVNGFERDNIAEKCGLDAAPVLSTGFEKFYIAYDCPRRMQG